MCWKTGGGYAVCWQLASINKCCRRGGGDMVWRERMKEEREIKGKEGRRQRMGGLIERDWYRCTEKRKRIWWVSWAPVMTHWTRSTCHHRLNQSAAPGGIMCLLPLPIIFFFFMWFDLRTTKSVVVRIYLTISVALSASFPCLVLTCLCVTQGLHQIQKTAEESET